MEIPNHADVAKLEKDGIGKVLPCSKSCTAILNFALFHGQPATSVKKKSSKWYHFVLNKFYAPSKAVVVKNGGGQSKVFVVFWCVFLFM